MLRNKEIITAVGTFACAMGIGFVMQNTAEAKVRYGERVDVIVPAEGVETVQGSALLDVRAITLTSAEFDSVTNKPSSQVVILPASVSGELEVEPEDLSAVPMANCEIVAQAETVPGAMVDLWLQAECLPNERVTVHHNGMIFTETTSSTGDARLRVPALSREAVFILAFNSGEGAVAQTAVDDIANFDRSVLQWKGNTGFEIHAREFGAEYGTAGHVWDGAPGTISGAVTGEGGVLTQHGDTSAPEPLLAEVYSFPKGYAGKSGTISLSVEAEVTAQNCGLEIEAQSLELQPEGNIKTQNLTLPVPDCESQGTFLVLNNLLQDLKVAGK